MQSGPVDQPQLHVPLSRGGGGAVSSVSLGSTDLLKYIDPLPMDQLLYHEVQVVHAWPESARDELLAVVRQCEPSGVVLRRLVFVTVTLTKAFVPGLGEHEL